MSPLTCVQLCYSAHRLAILGAAEEVDFGLGRPAGLLSLRIVLRATEAATLEENVAAQTAAAAVGALAPAIAGPLGATQQPGSKPAGAGLSRQVIASSGPASGNSLAGRSGDWAERREFLVGVPGEG